MKVHSAQLVVMTAVVGLVTTGFLISSYAPEFSSWFGISMSSAAMIGALLSLKWNRKLYALIALTSVASAVAVGKVGPMALVALVALAAIATRELFSEQPLSHNH